MGQSATMDRAGVAAGARSGGNADSVAIVGAGPGGLATAVLLAASGLKVRVYEAGDTIGGRTAHVRAGAYRFDRGPTFFMMPYVLEEIFAAAGKRLRDAVTLHRLDPMYRLLLGRPGKDPLVLDATQDLEAMASRIAAIHPRDGENFRRFMEHNRYKLRHSESILRNPMRSPLDLFRPETAVDTLKVGPVLNPHLSVHELLGRYFEHPLVKLGVSFQSKYLGMSPFECPSLFTILPFIEYEYGIWHPQGGCHALMRAMADLAVELGAEIWTSSPVRGVRIDGGRATAVEVDGDHAGLHQHAHVVINADATWAIKNLLPPDARARASSSYEPAKLDNMRYSCSTYMLYLGVRGTIDLPHHTIYTSGTYEQNLEDICVHGRLSEDPSIYLCNPSRLDPTLAPPGCSSLYVLIPTPNCRSGIDWAKEAPRLRRDAFEQMARRFGLADLPSRIEQEVQITPNDWRDGNINHGATFNLAHNLGQMLHRRPQNRLKGFENVYLVGGGTHPGSGLPTIFLSAQISSRLLCESLGVPFAGNRPQVRAVAQSREMVGV